MLFLVAAPSSAMRPVAASATQTFPSRSMSIPCGMKGQFAPEALHQVPFRSNFMIGSTC